MATIIIKRENEFQDKFTDFHIILDGKNIGTISIGQTKEFNATAGQHVLKAELAWCSSPIILVTVNEGETKEYIVKVDNFSKLATPLGILAFLLFIILSWAMKLQLIYATFFSGVFFLFIFYNTTIRRKKYLNISCI